VARRRGARLTVVPTFDSDLVPRSFNLASAGAGEGQKHLTAGSSSQRVIARRMNQMRIEMLSRILHAVVLKLGREQLRQNGMLMGIMTLSFPSAPAIGTLLV
jgi:hypothetical protein